MMKMSNKLMAKTLAILVFLLGNHTAVSSACAELENISPCSCFLTGDSVHIDCSGLGLQSVPDNLPERTSVLDFSNNLLQPETARSVCEYNFLEHVSIARNSLTQLKPRSLRKCDSVKRFNFSGNVFENVTKYTLYGLEFTPFIYGLEARKFTEDSLRDIIGLKELGIIFHQKNLPVSIFKDKKLTKLTIGIHGTTSIPLMLLDPLTSSLTDLTLTSSSIQRVPEHLLSDFTSLKTFNLDINELHSIPSTLFQNAALYSYLENISLSGIKSLPRLMFWGLGQLRHLEIHGVEDVPSDLFKGLLGLESLDLSDSFISVLPTHWFTDLWSLKSLNLHNIGLTIIKKEDLYNFGSLDRLDLSRNNLRNLYPELFVKISGSVKFINISQNLLKKVPGNLFKDHAVLECLDISNNQINSLENGTFYQLSELRHLYLQNNKLFDLKAATFLYSVNLVNLDMSSNILSDLPGQLFSSTHQLEVLNLSDNLLYNLERSIKFNISTLREINLSYNPIECNCETVIVKELLSKVSIIGDCVKPQPGIGIVDFVPDTNCILKSDTDSFGAEFYSSTIFLYPSESKTVAWESYAIISVNNVVSKTVQSYDSSAFLTTTGNGLYSSQELSDFWMNNSVKFNKSSIELDHFPVSELNASEFNVFGIPEITATPSYNETVSYSYESNLKVNDSQVYSSVLDTLKVQTSQSARGENISELIKFSVATTSVYNTDKTAVSKDEKIITTKKEFRSSVNTWNEGIGYSTVKPTQTLEPSFHTTAFIGISGTETFSETLQPTTVSQVHPSTISHSQGGSIPISPSRAISGNENGSKMTDGFPISYETNRSSLNVTVLPPTFEIGFSNVTSDLDAAEKGKKSDYFYLSLVSILSVAIFSVLILVFLYYKKRRNVQYEVQGRSDLNVYNLDHSFHEDIGVTPNSSLCQMKEVPSIQIETVDDDGNVKVEIYPVSEK